MTNIRPIIDLMLADLSVLNDDNGAISKAVRATSVCLHACGCAHARTCTVLGIKRRILLGMHATTGYPLALLTQ